MICNTNANMTYKYKHKQIILINLLFKKKSPWAPVNVGTEKNILPL